MRFRIISNKTLFSISDTKFKIGYSIWYNNKYDINTGEFEIRHYDRPSTNKFEMFPIILTNKHVNILKSKDVIISKIFVHSLYNKYIDKINKIQSNKLPFTYFKCNL